MDNKNQKHHILDTMLGVECETTDGYARHGESSPNRYWESVYDGSLPSDGREYKHAQPLTLATVLSEDDAATPDSELTINSKCGLHVHIGIRCNGIDSGQPISSTLCDDAFARREAAFLKLERFMFSVVARSRIGNEYCRPVVANEHHGLFSGHQNLAKRRQTDTSTRYKWLNLGVRRLTTECRLRHGTTNPHKIRTWCALLSAIATVADNNSHKTLLMWSELKILSEVKKLLLPIGYWGHVKNFVYDQWKSMGTGYPLSATPWVFELPVRRIEGHKLPVQNLDNL